MLSPNRTYPLDAACSGFTASKDTAAKHYNAAVVLTSTLLPEIYDDFPVFEPKRLPHPVYDNPVFNRYQALLNEAADRENAALLASYERRLSNCDPHEREALEVRGPQYVTVNVPTPYETCAFEFVPQSDGIRLAIKHWAPAPQYPALFELDELLRRRKLYPSSQSVADAHHACNGLKTVRLNPDHAKFAKILQTYEDCGAIKRDGDKTLFTYWELSPRYPVARTAKDIELGNIDYANNLTRAEAIANSACIVATEFRGKHYARQTTARKHYGDFLKHPWAELAQDKAGKWGVSVRFWKVDENSTRLTAFERRTLDERILSTLTPTVDQDTRPFGLFDRFDAGFHPLPDFNEEGSGRAMGL